MPFLLNWASVGANGTYSLANGTDTVGLTVATTTNALSQTARAFSSGSPSAPALWVSGISEPITSTLTFGAPVSNFSFEIYDIDSSPNSWDDKLTVLVTDAQGNVQAVNFGDLLADPYHSSSGNVLNADGSFNGGVETVGAEDSVAITIAGPVSRIQFIFDNGESFDRSGMFGVGNMSFDRAAPDFIVEGTANGDLIDDSYVLDPEGDRVNAGDAANGSDDDIIQAGAGNDTVISGAGNDSVDAGTGNDSVTAGTGNDTVLGGAGLDTIYGGAGADSLMGEADADLIYGGDDNDYVDGDGGADILHGDGGNDTIVGDDGNDVMYGGAGDDQIFASAGNNQAYGGSGADQVFLGAGNDTVDGGTGADLINTAGGNDTILLSDGFGNDTIIGGETAETAGDTLNLSALSAGATVDLSNANPETGTVSTSTSTATFSEIENIVLSNHDDIIVLGANTGAARVIGFQVPVDNGNGTYTGLDTINPGNLLDAQGNPVNAYDVTVTSLGGNAVLTFPGGQSLTLVGVDASAVSSIAQLAALGFAAPDGIVYGTAGDDTIDAAYLGDNDGDRIDAGDAILPGAGPNDDLVYAGAGNDSVDAGLGADSVVGEAGNDTLNGGEGNDTLVGDYEIDSDFSVRGNPIAGPGGNDVLTGGAGDDSIYGGSGDDSLYGGDGNDSLLGGHGNDLLEGGAGDDELEGLYGDDTIYGGDGNDLVYGRDGADLIYGGDGVDTLIGSIGIDTLYGGAGNDILAGSQGSDLIYGGDGDDLVFIGVPAPGDIAYDNEGSIYLDAGNDFLDASDATLRFDAYGGTGNDFMNAGLGDDTLFGGADNDQIYAGAGNDQLTGDEGNDYIEGQAGDDRFFLADGFGQDTLVGGETTEGAGDTLDASAVTQNITLDLSAGDATNPEDGTLSLDAANTATFSEIETVVLGSGDDSVTGSSGSDTVFTGSGADTVIGGAGNDSFDIGADSDRDVIVLADGFGSDTITHFDLTDSGDGTAIDQLDVSGLTSDGGVTPVNTSNVTVTDTNGDGTGDAILTFPGGESITLVGVLASQVDSYAELEAIGIPRTPEAVDGTAAGDLMPVGYVDAQGDIIDGADGLNDTIYGYGGDDTIIAGLGDDTVFAGDDNDSVAGGAGADLIYGGAGNDTLNGGDDADTIFGDAGADSIEGDTGDDLLWGGADGDTLAGGAGADTLLGDDGDDSLRGGADGDSLYGGAGNDTIQGDAGDDYAEGYFGDDLMSGGIGSDTLDGGDGNDQIFGGDDNDFLMGGDGQDQLDGGSGNDTLWSGAGDDTLIGGAGNDTMIGEGGDDTFTLSAGFGTDVIQGDEAGETNGDTIDASAITSAVVLDLSAGNPGDPESGTLTSGADVASFNTIENIVLGAGDDSVIGSSGADNVVTGAGADTVDGGAGDDRFALGADGDADVVRLSDGDGHDTIAGFDAPTVNPDGSFSGVDQLDVSDLFSTPGNPVDVDDVTVGDDGAGNAVLTFPNGEAVTLEGVSPALAADPKYLIALGIPSNYIVEGTSGADLIDAAYADDPEGDMIDAADNLAGNDDDIVQAGAGNDTVYSGAGDDLVYGEAGADLVQSGAGADTLYGGSGNDTLNGDAGADQLYGGDDRDQLTISGALEADSLTGGEGGDDFDTVELQGADAGVTVTYATNEAGSITDGTATALFSEIEAFNLTEFNDNLNGGVSTLALSVFAGAGNDTITGGSGADTLHGELGDDVIFGGLGNDSIRADEGDDTVFGGAGNDTIFGFEGSDSVDGGDGDDLINTRTSPGTGLPDQGYPGLYAADTDPNNDRDTVEGGAGNDTILTGDDDDLIYGGSGADSIDAGFDDDTVYGGSGNDTIIGSEGNDYVEGGLGNDVIYGGLAVGVADISSIPDATDLLPGNGLDTLYGGDGNDLIYGMDDADLLYGDAGNDTLYGGIDNDSLYGGDGADSLYGDEGDDRIETGAGDDAAYGGEGNDLIIGGGTGVDALFGDTGNDTITGSLTGNTLAYGGDGNDSITGGDLTDQLIGDDGDDIISGGGGADVLSGDAGNDTLYGGDGADNVSGGAGNDTIDGGEGADTLFGDDDRDLFYGGIGDVIDGGEGGDDFDTLNLSNLGGAAGTNIIYGGGNDESGIVEVLDGTGAVVGTFSFSNIESVIPCFTPGTMILTKDGEKPVESLQVGDKVLTRDNGYQTIRWVGQRHLSAHDLAAQPNFNPVRIRAGALGDNLPCRDMTVSPQHRMLISGPRAEMLFGEAEVLVAALHLVNDRSIVRAWPQQVTYIHLLFDEHEIIRADGAWTESFQPGDQTLHSIDSPQRAELLALFPELAQGDFYPAARITLKAYEAKVLMLQ
ncbi:hypothetical protein EGN72_15210 [Pseudorhodobacter sp. E13]|uniref:Hint domain-containing protein n=1 Tax=Pseudorhodobacter sp. E13 TaxID=2487931 RepID=UPI000F8E860D|nr:Hint domain-containing protein [Pseudorhodobacter sp. E13]RUS59289.1 hypothetical protein EGN72_15210 [Pseudorhodobacter sp. E13]